MIDPHSRKHHGVHLEGLIDESISAIAPYSALILTIIVCIIFLLRQYFFEKFLMPKVYKEKYLCLSDANRRSFINHHVAGLCKLTLLVTAAYPFIDITFGKGRPHTPFVHGSRVTLGDVMIVCSQLFTAMYIFELFYRSKISPVSGAHHIGAIVITQAAVAISLNFNHEVDAVYEFVLCFLWGGFDCLAELWPHASMIIYRIIPNRHVTLEKIFLVTCILELCGTVLETILVMWLFGSLWHRWTLPFKICTPLLHLLFSIAQLWGAYIFNQLRLREQEKIRAGMGSESDVEETSQVVEVVVEPKFSKIV